MSPHPLKKIGAASRPYVERLRGLCMALPEVTEKLAWGTPTWRVGGRVFAQLADHHHGNPHLAVWLAAPGGAQAALIEAEPARFFRPAYVGHLGWVAAILDERSDWEMVEAVVRQAHRVSAAKLGKQQAARILAAAEEGATKPEKPASKPEKPAAKRATKPARKPAPPPEVTAAKKPAPRAAAKPGKPSLPKRSGAARATPARKAARPSAARARGPSRRSAATGPR